MIKYNSRDIITRAEQLADIENSDFISDFEKTSLINESWVELYQKIVNANDKTFVKTVYAADGMNLPKDFYQLSALYCEGSKEQIQKMNSSQTEGYDVRNNQLILSPMFDDVSVVMEYYAVPQTLFYSSGKRESASYSYIPLVFLDKDFYIDTDNNIVEINNGVVSRASADSGLKLSNGILNLSTRVFEDWSGSETETKSSMPFVIKGNTVTYDDIQSDEDLSSYVAFITDRNGEQGYFVDSSGAVFTKDFQSTSVTLSASTLFFCREDGLYFTSYGSNKITRLLGTVTEVFSLSISRFCAFYDDNTCIVSINSNLYKQAYGFNSELSYPNNAYFTLLAYMLAISFKIKQQGDVTLLNSKYNEVLNQFLDSLSRDTNGFYIIRDVYRNGRRIAW